MNRVVLSLQPIIIEKEAEAENENNQDVEFQSFLQEQLKNEREIPLPLSGQFEGSFAYITIKDRMPVILTKVIDTLARQKNEVVEECNLVDASVIKDIVGRLSELRNEMLTNKAIRLLKGDNPDVALWNKYFYYQKKLYRFEPHWFWSPWLYSECYLYRRIKEAFELSPGTSMFDPFKDSKRETYTSSITAAIKLTEGLFQSIAEEREIYSNGIASDISKPKYFEKFVQVALWGNKCDLSLSPDYYCQQSDNPLDQVDSLKDNIIVNDIVELWNILQSANKKNPGAVIIDVILDNACFELFCDLCLWQYICALNLASKVRFHVKMMPWYVSDALVTDIQWLIDALQTDNNENMQKLGEIFSNNFETKVWTIEQENYWTLPHDFHDMKKSDYSLYLKLSESALLIFKGDLNYRKLASDRMWDPCTPFKTALRSFHPTSVCALRTIKNDVVTGLPNLSIKESLDNKDPKWLYKGEYAVIQCAP